MPIGMSEKPKLLFFISEDYYYWSHRRPLALAALAAGLRSGAGDPCRRHAKPDRGRWRARHFPLDQSRRNESAARPSYARSSDPHLPRRTPGPGAPCCDQAGDLRIARRTHCRRAQRRQCAGRARLRFHLANLARAGAAARLSGCSCAPPCDGAILILQNPDDVSLLCRERLIDRDRIRLVRGSGVDLDRFRPAPAPPAGAPVVVLTCAHVVGQGRRRVCRGRASSA